MSQLPLWPMHDTQHIVNVASVKHLSPFRYPGGKTWFVPRIRQWLLSAPKRPPLFVEPFAGGAIVGLTVAAEQMADHVLLAEIDAQIASVWQTVLGDDAEWLCEQILTFDLTAENVERALEQQASTRRERAFQTILRNRVNRGGILAPGAGCLKYGENGKGIRSRWYPETLCKRIHYIHHRLQNRITFVHGDGLQILREYAENPRAYFFLDPPYTAPGKKAGARLYTHHSLDHAQLFELAERVRGDFVMTYDNSTHTRHMASAHGFACAPVAMKNTHHAKMTELVISKCLDWLLG